MSVDFPVDWTTGFPEAEEPTRVEERSSQSSPGAWNEDLGKWGTDPWQLPGEGEPGPQCGEFYVDDVCTECGEPGFSAHKCGRRTCPECWGLWARDAAVRATARVQAFRHQQPPDYHRQVAHCVVSPPEGDCMNERAVWDWRKKAGNLANEKGMRGAAVIPHPWRPTDAARQLYNAVDPEVNIYVWIRNEAPADPQEYLYWSPHFHVIGVTTPDMEPAETGDAALWEFIRTVEPYTGPLDQESHNDLYGTFRYLLSHTGFPVDSQRQITTWIGDIANSVFVDNATESWQIDKPPESVQDLLERQIRVVAGDDPAVEDDAEGGDDNAKCDACGGMVIPVLDVTQFLRRNDPPPDVTDRMTTARDWRLGRREPPAGLKRPSNQADATKAFRKMTGGD